MMMINPLKWIAAKWIAVTTIGIRGWLAHREAKAKGEPPPEGGA